MKLHLLLKHLGISPTAIRQFLDPANDLSREEVRYYAQSWYEAILERAVKRVEATTEK